jgi:hypothetical protein
LTAIRHFKLIDAFTGYSLKMMTNKNKKKLIDLNGKYKELASNHPDFDEL